MDPNAALTEIATMDELVSESTAEPRFDAILMCSFGALGLALALLGIYGVMAYRVSQRTREIGVRMALGAQPRTVMRMVLREAAILGAAGIALGLGGALALTRLLRSLLFEINPTDPATFAVVAAIIFVVALAACWTPARRATKVDPTVALRHE